MIDMMADVEILSGVRSEKLIFRDTQNVIKCLEISETANIQQIIENR